MSNIPPREVFVDEMTDGKTSLISSAGVQRKARRENVERLWKR
jgi:hypothetical protein